MKLRACAVLGFLCITGCAQFSQVHLTSGYQETFDPSQCVEVFTWREELSTRGLFDRKITCTKTDVPEEVRVKDLLR